MTAAACILGCAGPVLTEAEARFFAEVRPWGFVLFARNIETPDQLRRLTEDLRASVRWAEAPILVDQEGGRVQRLGPPHWPRYPAARTYSDLAPEDRLDMLRLTARLMAHDLRSVGITANCLPVLDVPTPDADDVIGDRAYAETPEDVAAMGRAAAEGLLEGAVLPVIKHIPGHGRATSDSHHTLPVVDASRFELEMRDFAPFQALRDMPMAMTAHVVYAAVDDANPATTSRAVLSSIVRGLIGFEGLVISDDLSMQALSGDLAARAAAARAAGCDVVLHCNGDLEEMRAVALAAGPLTGRAQQRGRAAIGRITDPPRPFDVAEARARLEAAFEGRLAA